MNKCLFCGKKEGCFGVHLTVVHELITELDKPVKMRTSDTWVCDKCRITEQFMYVDSKHIVRHSPRGVGQVV